MDASKITQLLQKQNTKYINRSQTVDSSTLIWKNQIQSSKYIKGVKTCNGEQNCNAPTISSCNNGFIGESSKCSFGGAGRTTSIQTGSSKQVLSVYSGAEGSASRIYSSDSILLQNAGNNSCNTNSQNTYVVLTGNSVTPNAELQIPSYSYICSNTNGPVNGVIPSINNNLNPYLPQFDTYYNMKNNCIPTKDKNQKHYVKECHTPFIDNNGVNGIFNPCNNVTQFDPIKKKFHTTNTNPATCNGCILEPILESSNEKD